MIVTVLLGSAIAVDKNTAINFKYHFHRLLIYLLLLLFEYHRFRVYFRSGSIHDHSK